MQAALTPDHVHFIVLQWNILKFPLDKGRLIARHQALEANVFALAHHAALQEFQYADLDLCLTDGFRQSGYASVR